MVFAVLSVAAEMVIGFCLAVLVSRAVAGRIVYRTIFLLPILIPGIVIGAIWKLMYNPDFGVINQLLGARRACGRHDWLGDRALALLSVVVVDIWHWTPFVFLLLLAGHRSAAAGRVRGGARRRRQRLAGAALRHVAADAADDRS